MARLALALFVAAVVSAVPAAAQERQPPLPAHNGWIVFASDRGGAGEGVFRLHRLEPVGGAVTPLGLTGRQPAWSPDGALLAFVQDQYKLVVTRANGFRVRVLESDYPLSDPAWSPDGSRIVVAQALARRFRGDLAVVDVARARLTRITRTADNDTEPTWSPDGRWITFVSDRAPEPGAGDTELYHLRPDGRGLRRITANDFDDRSPGWSPDGSRIAFVSRRYLEDRRVADLWTIGPFGGPESPVRASSGPAGFPLWTEGSPAWSPDGQWLAYTSNQRWYWEDINIVSLDTGTTFDLTPESASFDVDPVWQPVCHVMGKLIGERLIGEVLRGTAFDDLVCGFEGRDTLVGGAGRDRLLGGFDNDTIRARDGERDIIGCGAGRDLVYADRLDFVGVDCERVLRR